MFDWHTSTRLQEDGPKFQQLSEEQNELSSFRQSSSGSIMMMDNVPSLPGFRSSLPRPSSAKNQ